MGGRWQLWHRWQVVRAPSSPRFADVKLEDFNKAFSIFDKLTLVNLINLIDYVLFLYLATFASIANWEQQLSIATTT